MKRKEAKQFLLDLATEWSPLFGLDDWDIEYEWHPDAIPGEVANALMVTTASWAYKHATIQVALGPCSHRTRGSLESTFFHECCHIICRVLPLPSKKGRVCSEEERFCTDFAQLVQRVAKHAYALGREAETDTPHPLTTRDLIQRIPPVISPDLCGTDQLSS